MKDKLREILDRIDERPDVGSIHEAKDEAISAILKLVEEERKELSSASDACSDWCKSEVKRKELESQLEESHKILDNDPSRIIRNAKDGYPDGRPDRILTLAERIKAICKYGADYKRWLENSESQLAELKQALCKVRVAGGLESEMARCFELVIARDKEIAELQTRYDTLERSVLNLDHPNIKMYRNELDELKREVVYALKDAISRASDGHSHLTKAKSLLAKMESKG